MVAIILLPFIVLDKGTNNLSLSLVGFFAPAESMSEAKGLCRREKYWYIIYEA